MPATSDAPAEARAFDELLEALVESDGLDRVLVASEALRAGMGGMKVADHRCGRSVHEPAVMTFAQLFRHLIQTDTPSQIERRGFRMHTKLNVAPWDDEQPGHGPALGTGPA